MKVLLFLISIISILFYFFDRQMSVENAPYIVALSIIISTISILPRVNIKGVHLEVILVLFIGILFFNIKWFALSLFNPIEFEDAIMSRSISKLSFYKSSLMLSCSLPLISLSYIYSIRHKAPNYSEYIQRDKISLLPMLILSFLTLLLSLRETGLTVGALYIGSSNSWFPFMIRFVQLSAIIYSYNYYYGYQETKFNKILLICLIVLYEVYLLIGGERGNSLSVILILGFTYLLKENYTLSKKQFVLVVILAIVFVGVFNQIETLRVDGSQMTTAGIFEKSDENSTQSSEMCTCLAYDGITQGKYPHTWGSLSLISIIQSIPYLGSKLLDVFSVPSSLRSNSAGLVTIQYYGIDYNSGLGTTYLADSYIEFGIWGVVLVSILLGIFVAWIDNNLRNRHSFNIFSFLLVSYFFAYSIYFGRAAVLSFFCNFIHASILFELYYIIFKHVK